MFCERVFDLVSFELYCKDELSCVIPIFLVWLAHVLLVLKCLAWFCCFASQVNMQDLIWLRHFLFLATWPNKLTMTLIHWQPLELKPLFLVLSILLNLKKKKDQVFFPYLREKEGASGLCWDWLRNKVWGWVFPPHKVIKMAKGK